MLTLIAARCHLSVLEARTLLRRASRRAKLFKGQLSRLLEPLLTAHFFLTSISDGAPVSSASNIVTRFSAAVAGAANAAPATRIAPALIRAFRNRIASWLNLEGLFGVTFAQFVGVPNVPPQDEGDAKDGDAERDRSSTVESL